MKEAGSLVDWARRLLQECREALGMLLPLEANEREFLDRLLEHGEIAPSLLTQDAELADRILRHPGLAWKALNARRSKGGRPSTG